jgi:hypothetical protein
VGTRFLLLKLCYAWQIIIYSTKYMLSSDVAPGGKTMSSFSPGMKTYHVHSGASTKRSISKVQGIQGTEVRDEQVSLVTFRRQGTSRWSCGDCFLKSGFLLNVHCSALVPSSCHCEECRQKASTRVWKGRQLQLNISTATHLAISAT